MISSIKSEWRKTRQRPAFLVAAGLIAGIAALAYVFNYYQALHPSPREVAAGVAPLLKLELYPHELVNNVIGAAFPLGAAMAVVLGALGVGSEYSWSTLKTMLTQRPGRLTTLAGRFVVLQAWMLIVTLALFGAGAASSTVVALVDNHAIEWPPIIDLAKGIGAVWLILGTYGTLGMVLGTIFRQAAAALGVGLIYLAIVQTILVRMIGAFNNGQFRWLTDWFDGQNAQFLIQSFTSPAFGRPAPPAVDATHGALVVAAYLALFALATAVFLKRRDVA